MLDLKFESEIAVEYIDHMGSDLSVVNAARVSFNKQVDTFQDRDEKLLKYLATHKHWTPFAHTSISVRVKVPIFLARQLVKHTVGLVLNEVSRRYVDTPPEFYIPKTLHERPTNAKQGCGDGLGANLNGTLIADYFMQGSQEALDKYTELLAFGVAPEEARMVLPLNTMTEFIWTGSLVAFHRVFNQRSDAHAQLAAQEFADKLGKVIEPLYPVSWKVLNQN